MRKYQQIWLQLKDKKKISLKVLPTAVRRVKKAISKEKDMDQLFKLEHCNDPWKIHWEYSFADRRLKVWMVQQFGFMPTFSEEETDEIKIS